MNNRARGPKRGSDLHLKHTNSRENPHARRSVKSGAQTRDVHWNRGSVSDDKSKIRSILRKLATNIRLLKLPEELSTELEFLVQQMKKTSGSAKTSSEFWKLWRSYKYHMTEAATKEDLSSAAEFCKTQLDKIDRRLQSHVSGAKYQEYRGKIASAKSICESLEIPSLIPILHSIRRILARSCAQDADVSYCNSTVNVVIESIQGILDRNATKEALLEDLDGVETQLLNLIPHKIEAQKQKQHKCEQTPPVLVKETQEKGKIEKSRSIGRFNLREATNSNGKLGQMLPMVQSSPRLVTYRNMNSESSSSYNCESDAMFSCRAVKIEASVEPKEEESSGSMGHLPPDVGFHANGKPVEYEYEYYYSDE